MSPHRLAGGNSTDRARLEKRFRQVVESAPNGIVVVNARGWIILVNAQTEKMFGYRRDELIGKSMEVLVPVRMRATHPAYRNTFFEAPSARPMGAGRDLFGLRKDGTEFPIEIGLNPIDTDEGVMVLSAIVDITERKRADNQVKAALREKEILLKEVYHRVKNNLQVSASLLNLQARSTAEPAVRDVLTLSANRIKSMALIHEKLYESGDLARVSASDYFGSLVDHLLQVYQRKSAPIGVNIRCHEVSLGIDSAIPCGLIANELISNALTHAFPSGRTGTLEVGFLRHSETALTLEISDDGVGLPAGFDIERTSSLGLKLVTMLTSQLGGEMTIAQSPGTTFRITFPTETR